MLTPKWLLVLVIIKFKNQILLLKLKKLFLLDDKTAKPERNSASKFQNKYNV